MRKQFLQFGKVVQAQIAFVQNVVENDDVWGVLRSGLEGLGTSSDANQFIIIQSVLIKLILEIVVLHDQDAWLLHLGWVEPKGRTRGVQVEKRLSHSHFRGT